MKKILSALLALTLLFCLCACGESGASSGKNNHDGVGGSNDAAGSGEADKSEKTKILCELKSDDGKTSYTYKWNGNTLTVEQKMNSILLTMTYEYDENGSLMKKSGEITRDDETSKTTDTYQYDDKGRRTFLSEVISRSSGDDIKSEYTYTYSDDGKTCTGLSEGASEIQTYNDKGQLTEVKATVGDSTNNLKYEYDENGNCTLYSLDVPKYNANITYTADGKLATMVSDDESFTCAYDDEGYLKTVSVKTGSFDDTILKAVWVDGTEFKRSHTPAYPFSILPGGEIDYHY